MTDETVQPIYDNWGNRASTLEPELTTETERVFKVGCQFSLTVPNDPAQPAKVAHLYHRWGRSENPMPNMEVMDGELRIPVEDLADLILRLIPAAELAEGLWRSQEVRDRFAECMANRYAGDSMTDEDRRAFLAKVQEAIHSVALDDAITRLNQLESNARSYTSNYRWRVIEMGHYQGLFEQHRNALYEMREAGLLDDDTVRQRLGYHFTPERLKESLEESTDPVVKESVGAHWNESRNFWREELKKVFPAPERQPTADQEEIA